MGECYTPPTGPCYLPWPCSTVVRMEREDRLFDDFERTDDKPARENESGFEHLNRRAGPLWAEARALLEAAFLKYPRERRPDMRGRLTKREPDQHNGAILELLLFGALASHNVEVRPDTPDFEFISDGEWYQLEATTLADPDEVPPLLSDVFANIAARLSSRDYALRIAVRGELVCMPAAKIYCEPLRRLLETPRDTVVIEQLETWPTELISLRKFGTPDQCGRDCAIEVQLIPFDRPRNEGDLIIMADSSEARWMWEVEEGGSARILGKLKEKSAALPSDAKRSYIAVSVPDLFLLEPTDAVLRALYGFSRALRREGVAPPREYLWGGFGQHRSHIEGVIVFGPLHAAALDHPQFSSCLYMAPGAGEPPDPLSRLPRARFDDGEIETSDGEKLGALVRDGLGVSN